MIELSLDDDFKMISKKMVMACFKEQSYHLPGETKNLKITSL